MYIFSIFLAGTPTEMGMFWEFFTFELRFRAKSLSTYMYFLLWFAFAFFSVASESFGPIGNSNGKVLLNGPYANTFNDMYIGLFGVIVIAAIFGTSILRDFQRDTFQLLFTKPISKFAYLGGRWSGSFVATVFVFSGTMFGTYIGTLAPWADHARIGPNHAWWYLQPFLSIVVVQIFFIGSLFFCVAALTRRIFIVYLQGVALFMLYVIGLTVFSATRSLEHFWSGIFDPIGLQLLETVARYWSVIEKNTLLLGWDFSGYSPGVVLYNRVLWLGVGSAALAAMGLLFPMSVEALTAKAQGRRAAKARQQETDTNRPTRSLVTKQLPKVRPRFGPATTWAQYLSLTRLRIRTIFSEIPFWAIVGLLVVFAINNGHFAGRVGGDNVWPVTYLMLQAVEGSAQLFFYIVAALYSAELVWRERDTRFQGIHDALPMGEGVDWLSKLTAVVLAEIVLLCVTIAIGVVMQVIDGYYHFELAQYLQEMFLVTLPQLVALTLFAMFVQTMVSNKFVGHGIVIGILVLQPILVNFGWENTLYVPAGVPPYIYSDMNGYGHFVAPLAVGIAYWFAVFAVLGVVSVAFARRGAEDSLKARLRTARQRALAVLPYAAAFLVLALASGVWYYYNTQVLNEYLTADDRRKIQADLERQFKQYQRLPQPKITSVDVSVNIYPERRSFDASGTYTLQNKTNAPIRNIHLTDKYETTSHVAFDRAFHEVSRAARNAYSIYALDRPLDPGETMTLKFKVELASHGFRNNNELAQFAANGTFFDSDFFPHIGYEENNELDDPRRRREQGLKDLEEMSPRGDPLDAHVSLFSRDADWVSYHAVVSTSVDQIALAPGYLKHEWLDKGRRYFEYSMGATPIMNFQAYLSGRYSVRRAIYASQNGPINLEVYYAPEHSYNIDTMLEASRAGLDYFDSNFGAYQFDQYRIIEFPRYREFAQSFSNTVPYSEGIGFITRVVNDTDVDLTYFVTAHELAHQWWGHQLVGGRVEGSNMMSETLAEYSAYMVMEKKYGKDYMHRVMHHFLDRYLRGRSAEVRHELPLARVQREAYVWYYKGGQIMYTLADYIGEDRVNLALKNFLTHYRYANAGNAGPDQPFPDTRMLVDALRQETPPEYQYLIDDGFDRIVLYDNKTLTASSIAIGEGKYRVDLAVQARKMQADGNGAETSMRMNDYIDIGVFSGTKDHEKPLYLQRAKLTAEHATYSIVVDEEPSRAGIDPYNKLIDRVADDNMIDVVRR